MASAQTDLDRSRGQTWAACEIWPSSTELVRFRPNQVGSDHTWPNSTAFGRISAKFRPKSTQVWPRGTTFGNAWPMLAGIGRKPAQLWPTSATLGPRSTKLGRMPPALARLRTHLCQMWISVDQVRAAFDPGRGRFIYSGGTLPRVSDFSTECGPGALRRSRDTDRIWANSGNVSVEAATHTHVTQPGHIAFAPLICSASFDQAWLKSGQVLAKARAELSAKLGPTSVEFGRHTAPAVRLHVARERRRIRTITAERIIKVTGGIP